MTSSNSGGLSQPATAGDCCSAQPTWTPTSNPAAEPKSLHPYAHRMHRRIQRLEVAAEHGQGLRQRAARDPEVLADARHPALPVARPLAGKGPTLVGNYGEATDLSLSDHERIGTVAASAAGGEHLVDDAH